MNGYHIQTEPFDGTLNQQSTVYVQVTEVGAGSQSIPTFEVAETVQAGWGVDVSIPFTPGFSFNVYASTVSGQEVLQNTSGPIGSDGNYVIDPARLVTTGLPAPVAPSVPTTQYPDQTYMVAIAWESPAGTSLPSPAAHAGLLTGQLLTVTPNSPPSGATGYDVYVYSDLGQWVQVNLSPVPVTQTWQEPDSGIGIVGLTAPADIGDSNLTQVTAHVDSNPAHDRVNLNLYDWRDRHIAAKQGALMSGGGNDLANETVGANAIHRLITLYVLDNAGETTGTYTIAADGVNLNDFAAANAIDAEGFPTVDTSNIRQMSLSSFDDQGRVYKSQQFSVNQNTGLSGLSDSQIWSLPNLYTSTYYDLNGQTIATYAPGGLVTKNAYDGAGREVETYTTDGGALANGGTIPTTWAAAASVANDVVIEQTDRTYDANSNVIETATHERFESDPETGAGATGPLGGEQGGSPLAAYTILETADRSGHGNTPTVVGGVTWGVGAPASNAGAYTFDGSTGYVDLGNPADLNFTGQITISTWVKLGDTSPNGEEDIVCHGPAYSPNSAVFLKLWGGSYECGTWTSNGTYWASSTIPAGDVGQWVQLVATYDGANWNLYRNGALVSDREKGSTGKRGQRPKSHFV